MDNLTLNNGVVMPALGFSVFQNPPEETRASVATALESGYRHIAAAAAYFSERQVGEAIAASGIARDELFLQTSLWISDYGRDKTLRGFEKSTRKLGVDRLDLVLLHQPLTSVFDRTIEAWHVLEQLLAEGRVRAIGVSNFMPGDLKALLAAASVVPAVNQIELHPYFSQPEVQALNAEHGIITQAWSPIGGVTFYPGWAGSPHHSSALADPVIVGIAEAHGRTPAQVMLRWHLQQGRSAIPKSANPGRIAENLDVFGFTLTATELAALDALDTGVRGGPDPAAITLDTFKGEIPEE
jgi:2,5-diketo-D-gluconate reductase A